MFSRSSSASFRTRNSPSTGEMTNSPAGDSGALALIMPWLPKGGPCLGAGAPWQVWGQTHAPLPQIQEGCDSWGLCWMHSKESAGAGDGVNGQIRGACCCFLGLSEDANNPSVPWDGQSRVGYTAQTPPMSQRASSCFL